MNWGPEIKHDGGPKPAWVRDGEPMERNFATTIAPLWQRCTSFRLPADHWAYAAIGKGFVPWAGGDSAPDDWDGGEVLRGDGVFLTAYSFLDWKIRFPKEISIIGYRRKEAWQPDAAKVREDAIKECIAALPPIPCSLNSLSLVEPFRDCHRALESLLPKQDPAEALAEEYLTTNYGKLVAITKEDAINLTRWLLAKQAGEKG